MTQSPFCLAQNLFLHLDRGRIQEQDHLFLRRCHWQGLRLSSLLPLDYINGVSIGNPVTAYLQHHGVAQDQPIPFNNAYTLTNTNAPATFNVPAANERYSQISGNYNPIHINPYFSDLASLPGTITHGMWSSAATRKYVETVVAQGKPEHVIA